mmetsp:Transcript_58446/g.161723  ORF Transcript_58446/g.161723 Transcript_58446/m.161723 type:complete len:218 (+) Transcript_58446:295-948(+)
MPPEQRRRRMAGGNTRQRDVVTVAPVRDITVSSWPPASFATQTLKQIKAKVEQMRWLLRVMARTSWSTWMQGLIRSEIWPWIFRMKKSWFALPSKPFIMITESGDAGLKAIAPSMPNTAYTIPLVTNEPFNRPARSFACPCQDDVILGRIGTFPYVKITVTTSSMTFLADTFSKPEVHALMPSASNREAACTASAATMTSKEMHPRVGMWRKMEEGT